MNELDATNELDELKRKIFEGKAPIEPNYLFFFSEKEARNYFVGLWKQFGRTFANLSERLHQNRAMYDGDSPTKDTYVFMYSRPLSYHFARLISKIRKNKDKLDKIIADYFLGAFDHESLHQVLDEYVGYCPSNKIQKLNTEVLLYKLAKEGYACKLKF